MDINCSSLRKNRLFVSGKFIRLIFFYKNKYYLRAYALWARLGDLNYLSNTDNARAKDYKIVERIIHPNYRPPSLYNDIALFRLEKDVVFSAYIRPICLNADNLLKPSSVIATGWGQIEFG